MPASCEGLDQLHQGIDVAADHAVTGLHALDGRQGQAGQLGQLALVDLQQGTGGTHLRGGDHPGGGLVVVAG